MPSVRKSQFKLIRNLLKQLAIPHKLNKQEMTIQINSNEIIFSGLDDVEKIKSIEGINYIWVEEATEISLEDYDQLDFRARGKNPNGRNRLYYTFNPCDYSSFLRKICQNPPKEVDLNVSTYRDNMFLSPDDIAAVERTIEKDEAWHKIYNLGQWAQTGNIIYTNWSVCSEEDWPDEFDETSYGLDFGFAKSECALIEINRIGMETWERQLIYETGLTVSKLIARLPDKVADKDSVITADNARPDSIEEIFDAGYNVQPCIKGMGSIKQGIDIVQRFHTHLYSDSVDLIEEKQGYKWQKRKDGVILEKPVKWKDHLMDAERYDLSRHVDMIPGLFPLEDEKEKIDINVIEIDSEIVEARRWKMMCED